jgi:hypothetical protein
MQSLDCNLHQINLGLWVHLLDAVTAGIKDFLTRPVLVDGKRVISETAISEVWSRLGSRFALMPRCTAGISFSAKITSFATDMQTRKSAKKSKICIIEGREHFRLMMVSAAPPAGANQYRPMQSITKLNFDQLFLILIF